MNDPMIIRAQGLGGGRTVEAPVRRSVEREHLAFVAAHKHRMSWQAMAKACGVNQHDLRRACDRAYADGCPAPVAPAPRADKPAGSGSSKRSMPPLKVLQAIHKGARTRDDIAELLGGTAHSLTSPIAVLRKWGWLAGHSKSFTGWVITNAGQRALLKVAEGGAGE